MKERRSSTNIIVVNKKTGEWEVNTIENSLDKDYLTSQLCIYHTWDKIVCTRDELATLQKKYPIIVSDSLVIRPEEENNVPF